MIRPYPSPLGRSIKKLLSAADHSLIPLAAILILHQQDVAVIAEPSPKPCGMKKHERHERESSRRVGVGMRAEEVAKSRRFLAKIGSDGRIAVGSTVAFIKQEIKHLVDAVEPFQKLRRGGRLEGDL